MQTNKRRGITKKTNKQQKLPIKTHRTKHEPLIYAGGVLVAPSAPPLGMKCVCSGINLGKWTDSGSAPIEMDTPTGTRMILSGIKLDGVTKEEEVEFVVKSSNGSARTAAYPERKKDGVYLGPSKILSCAPNQSVMIEHIYSSSSVNLVLKW